MDYQKLGEEFWRDGFVVVDDFFGGQLMDACTAAILDHYGESPEYVHSGEYIKKSQTEVVCWYPLEEKVAPFERVHGDPRMAQLTAQVLGDGYQDLTCMVMFSSSGTIGQAWH